MKENLTRHEQIARWIRDKIRSGEYSPDEKLPSENRLTRRFGVSRVTVRRALQTLESEHLIYRCQGLGSFVKGEKNLADPLQLIDFMEEMRRNGLEAASVVLEKEVAPASPEVASRLNLAIGTRVFRLNRLRLADGNPVALDYTWLPAFYGQLIVDADLENQTIFQILENEYDIRITSGCYYLQAENANAYLAKHLGIGSGTALFRMDRISFTLDEKPVYYQQRFYRSDRFMYRLKVERSSGQAGRPEMPLSEISVEFRAGSVV